MVSGVAAFAVAMALCGLVGLGLESVAYRPLRRPYSLRAIVVIFIPVAMLARRIGGRSYGWELEDLVLFYGLAIVLNRYAASRGVAPSGRLVPLITAIGASLFIEYTTQHRALFGNRPRGFPSESLGLSAGAPIRVGELVIDRLDLLVIGVTLALVTLLTLIVRRTRLGLAMRAVSDNPDAAVLMGVSPDRVVRFSFVLGGALAGAAGVLWAMKYPTVDPLMGIMPGLKAFVAAVIGGIGSLPGAVLGGLVMGLAEAFLAASPLSEYKDALAFVLLIGVLLLRPSGLLGRRLPEKV